MNTVRVLVLVCGFASLVGLCLAQISSAGTGSETGPTAVVSGAGRQTGGQALDSDAGDGKEGEGEGNGNIATQLASGVKEWVVSYGDAFKQMRRDHERCNIIRQKQGRYKAALRSEWEDLGKDPKEIRSKLSKVSGGISFEEYLFLKKGKTDREKLISLVFYASFLPKVMPYMIMFNANNMLPDQFPKKAPAFGETKRETISRERSHAVIKMLIDIERNAHVQAFSINPFAGAYKQKQMENYQSLRDAVVNALVRDVGPDYVMKSLDEHLFLPERPTAKQTSLALVPKVLTRGLASVVSSSSNKPLAGLIPNFIDRSTLLNHVKSVTQSDEFLINQSVDINTLNIPTLVEACSDRLMATQGKTEEELKEKLSNWLRYAAVVPSRRTRKTGEAFNGNLARSALMCYYAMDGVRQKQSGTPITRLLMQTAKYDTSSVSKY